MRRTLIVLAVVLAVLLVATPGLVAARGPGGGGGQGGDHQGGAWFSVYGAAIDVDCENAAITLDVTNPSGLAGELTVYFASDTRFTDCVGEEEERDVDCDYLADLIAAAEEDDEDDVDYPNARVTGTVVDEAYFATAVILNPFTAP